MHWSITKLRTKIIRKYYFFKYNSMPFRLSLVMNHMLKRIASGLRLKKGSRIIDLALTYDCNLNCQHCSAMILQKNAPLLTLDNYKSIVKQSKKLDVLSWNITGGEPLVIDWLEDLIPILEPKTHYISIQTNCMLLDEKTAQKLAGLGVNCITKLS